MAAFGIDGSMIFIIAIIGGFIAFIVYAVKHKAGEGGFGGGRDIAKVEARGTKAEAGEEVAEEKSERAGAKSEMEAEASERAEELKENVEEYVIREEMQKITVAKKMRERIIDIRDAGYGALDKEYQGIPAANVLFGLLTKLSNTITAEISQGNSLYKMEDYEARADRASSADEVLRDNLVKSEVKMSNIAWFSEAIGLRTLGRRARAAFFVLKKMEVRVRNLLKSEGSLNVKANATFKKVPALEDKLKKAIADFENKQKLAEQEITHFKSALQIRKTPDALFQEYSAMRKIQIASAKALVNVLKRQEDIINLKIKAIKIRAKRIGVKASVVRALILRDAALRTIQRLERRKQAEKQTAINTENLQKLSATPLKNGYIAIKEEIQQLKKEQQETAAMIKEEAMVIKYL
jgi:uncharacterized protein YdcH (DUF465 family)